MVFSLRLLLPVKGNQVTWALYSQLFDLWPSPVPDLPPGSNVSCQVAKPEEKDETHSQKAPKWERTQALSRQWFLFLMRWWKTKDESVDANNIMIYLSLNIPFSIRVSYNSNWCSISSNCREPVAPTTWTTDFPSQNPAWPKKVNIMAMWKAVSISPSVFEPSCPIPML